LILLEKILILLYHYNSYIYKNYNGRGVSKIMSSLQKFHRRTMSLGPPPFSFTAIGVGSDTVGYWLGDISSNKLIVAPKSTGIASTQWGSFNIFRGTTSTTTGLTNTNTLYAFGNSITTGHPAAYYCKTLTQGGYNTWYMPAIDELTTLYSNKSATPFAVANGFPVGAYWSSTQNDATGVSWLRLDNGAGGSYEQTRAYRVRAVRRTTV
jgi:hypothetical protein